jgi:hypothetical protein
MVWKLELPSFQLHLQVEHLFRPYKDIPNNVEILTIDIENELKYMNKYNMP